MKLTPEQRSAQNSRAIDIASAQAIAAGEKAYHVEWLLSPVGDVVSFRWERAAWRKGLSRLLDQGYTRIADPFRKGAPLGGHGRVVLHPPTFYQPREESDYDSQS